MLFDTLEIQKNIEEKRLILGQRLERFLLQKLLLIVDFFSRVFAARSCAFFGCLMVVAISVLVRSTRDIGHDSAVYLEIAQKMLNGGKYYQDFFENNLPLSFLLTIIPVFLAKVFGASPIIFTEIFVNLVGISALYLSAKILDRSDVSKDKTIFNLIIISFAVGFFLRVLTLQYNEFATKSTYFLAFAFPYLAYQFRQESTLRKSDQIFSGLLAAAFFCLKPHYGILAIVFEVKKLWEKKSLKAVFCLRNYVTFVVLILYLLLLFIGFPDYISAISSFSSIYYDSQYFKISLMLKEDLFPIFALIFLCFSLIRKSPSLQIFFLTTLATSLIIILEVMGGSDQRFVLYSLSLPLLVLLMLTIIRNQQIDWKKNWFALLLILLAPQFDQSFFVATAFNLCAFWWMFAVALSWQWRRILAANEANFGSKFNNFFSLLFFQRNLTSWIFFLILAAFSISLSFHPDTNIFAWPVSAVIFILMMIFYQNLYEKFVVAEKFSRFSACIIFMVLSYFISLHLAAIFSAHHNKSPNYVNEQIIKNYSEQGGDLTIISSAISGSYPAVNYLKIENALPSSQLLTLYGKIEDKKEMSAVQKYLFLRLKQQLENPQNRLVFVENKLYAYDAQCRIGFLEYYFRDPEFKKLFLQNYVFLNRIIEILPSKQVVEFFNDGHDFSVTGKSDLIERDIDIYIRK